MISWQALSVTQQTELILTDDVTNTITALHLFARIGRASINNY